MVNHSILKAFPIKYAPWKTKAEMITAKKQTCPICNRKEIRDHDLEDRGFCPDHERQFKQWIDQCDFPCFVFDELGISECGDHKTCRRKGIQAYFKAIAEIELDTYQQNKGE